MSAATVRASLLALLAGVSLVVVVVLILAGVAVAGLAILAPLFDLTGVPSTGNWIGRV